MGSVMVPVWALAARKVRKELSRTGVPLLGIGAAFSFLLMMFNVPLPGGTSGHAVGGMLLAVVLGPWSACIAISVALLVQALMFGDGGILAFGANSFNMAFVIPFLGFFIFRATRGLFKGRKGEYAGLVAGSVVSSAIGALCAAVELGVQPLLFRGSSGLPLYFPYPLGISIPAMVVPHLVIAGAVESVLTVAVVAFLRRVSPNALPAEVPGPRLRGFYAALAVLISLSPLGLLASGAAWGEWRVDALAKLVGFTPEGMKRGVGFTALFPSYAVPGLSGVLGYALSAVAGAAVLIIAFKLFSLARREARRRSSDAGG